MPTSSSAEAVYDTGGDRGDGVGREARHSPSSTPTIIVRYATAEDILAFYGEPPHGTLRALVAEMDGEIVGVIGIVREERWGVFFSDVTSVLQPHLKSITIMRAIKRALRFCDEYRGPVFARAIDAESCRLMNRLGFTHLYGGWYGWLG